MGWKAVREGRGLGRWGLQLPCHTALFSGGPRPPLPPFVPGAMNRAGWACGHMAGSHGPLPWALQGQVTAHTPGWALLGSLAVT